MKTSIIFCLLLSWTSFNLTAQSMDNLMADATTENNRVARADRTGQKLSGEPSSEISRAASSYDLMAYLYNNISYPELAQENAIEGKVIAQLEIDKDGSVKEVKIVKGLGFGCDEEVIRVLSTMPNWEPAKQNGSTVAQYVTIPIHFRMQ